MLFSLGHLWQVTASPNFLTGSVTFTQKGASLGSQDAKSGGPPAHSHFCQPLSSEVPTATLSHQVCTFQGFPRPPSDVMISQKDSQSSLRAGTLTVLVSYNKGDRLQSASGRGSWEGSRRAPGAELPDVPSQWRHGQRLPLPVTWQYTWNIVNQGNP